MKYCFIVAAFCLFAVCSQAKEFYANKALNPVKFSKAAHAATAPGSIERKRVEFFSSPWKKDFEAARAYCNMVIPSCEVKQLGKNETITIDGKLTEVIWKRAKAMLMQQAKGQGGALPFKPQTKLV